MGRLKNSHFSSIDIHSVNARFKSPSSIWECDPHGTLMSQTAIRVVSSRSWEYVSGVSNENLIRGWIMIGVPWMLELRTVFFNWMNSQEIMQILMKGLTIRTLVFCDSLVLRGRSYFGDERVGEGWRWTTKSRGVILRCGKQQHHPYQQWRGSIGIALGGFWSHPQLNSLGGNVASRLGANLATLVNHHGLQACWKSPMEKSYISGLISNSFFSIIDKGSKIML